MGEHYGELEGAMERDLQEAMATLAQEGQGRPEDGEHLVSRLDGAHSLGTSDDRQARSTAAATSRSGLEGSRLVSMGCSAMG